MLAYLHWQFFVGPVWLLTLYWNLERAILQFFSVPVMLRTLLAHWRKDRVSLKGTGTFGRLFEALAWNVISRLIGFLLRITVLFTWAITQALFVAGATAFLILFVAWPLITAIVMATGVSLLF